MLGVSLLVDDQRGFVELGAELPVELALPIGRGVADVFLRRTAAGEQGSGYDASGRKESFHSVQKPRSRLMQFGDRCT